MKKIIMAGGLFLVMALALGGATIVALDVGVETDTNSYDVYTGKPLGVSSMCPKHDPECDNPPGQYP